MNVQEMTLTNFKKFQSKTIKFSGHTIIEGDNKTGKSTIADAFLWLFTSQTSTGIKDIAYPKPIVNGEEVHHLETSVVVTIDEVEYKRLLIENWTPERGGEKPTFTGNDSSYEINGLPLTQTKFNKQVESMFGDNALLKILTRVDSITGMNWKVRRTLLTGENKEIQALSDQNEIHKHSRKKLKDQTKEIPARIDELHNSITEAVSVVDKEASTQKDLETAQGKLSQIQNGGKSFEIREQISKLNHEKDKNEELQATHVNEQAKKNSGDISSLVIQVDQEIESLRNNRDLEEERQNKTRDDSQKELDGLKDELTDQRGVYRVVVSELLEMNDKIADLRTDRKKNIDIKYNGATACPACKQDLPADQVDDAVARFNKRKSEFLENNIVEGKKLKKNIDEHESTKADLENEIIVLENKIEAFVIPERVTIDVKSSDFLTELNGKMAVLKDFKPVPDAALESESKRIEKEVSALEQQLESGDTSEQEESIQRDIDGLKEQLKEYQNQNATVKQEMKTKERIEELRTELSEVSDKIASVEQEIAKVEELIKEAILKVETELNERFRITRWKLFETQINGGVIPCCTPMVDGITFEKLNRATQMNCGIDIINTLSRESGVSFPLFVDNAECNTDIEPTDSQIIKLIVKKNDCTECSWTEFKDGKCASCGTPEPVKELSVYNQ